MKRLVLLPILLFATPALAEGTPVVVELFTSQGCSSCPPADEFLTQLTKRDDVLPLAFHIDYWDYLGWKDPFSLAECTARQREYAKRTGRVFTPQMIINGDTMEVGSDRASVLADIDNEKKHGNPVTVSLARVEGKKLDIKLRTEKGLHQKSLDVWLINYVGQSETNIRAGENKGLHLINTNVVTAITYVASWDGKPASFKADEKGGNTAVLVQEAGHGRIVGAETLRR